MLVQGQEPAGAGGHVFARVRVDRRRRRVRPVVQGDDALPAPLRRGAFVVDALQYQLHVVAGRSFEDVHAFGVWTVRFVFIGSENPVFFTEMTPARLRRRRRR